MWSVKEKKLTNMTANEAWDAYQRGALQNFNTGDGSVCGRDAPVLCSL